MIIVGSTALAFFGIARTTPKDIDNWLTAGEQSTGRTDCHIMPKNIIDMIPVIGAYAVPDAIYTMKCSHLSWDVHWQKTKLDILWLESQGCILMPDLYKELKAHWVKEKGGKEYLSLDKTKAEFFDDYVSHKYDHDYLHELVSYPNKPIYIQCLKGEVLIDKSKFNGLNFADKVRMFREEITVIACERFLITGLTKSWHNAYAMALKKVIVSLTKNWANDFIILNLKHFNTPNYTYFKYLLKEINMSEEVNLEPFQELLDGLGIPYSDLTEVIYKMVSGYFDPTLSGIPYPKLNGRDYLNSEYRKEVATCMKARKDFLENTLKYKHIIQEGGGEGGSESCYGVFSFRGILYKAEYLYFSHEGCKYYDIVDTLRVVEAKEKTITVYT